MLQVLIVDDHEVVRAGYRRLFESTDDLSVVGEAASGEEAVGRYRELRPDVVVMDIAMQGIGGLEASRRILSMHEDARVLVFSVHESPQYVDRALDAGVLGYVSKRSVSRVVLDAVRTVAAGRPYLGPGLFRENAAAGADRAGRLRLLTNREFEVFRHVAEGHSVNQVAEILHLSPKTVSHHYTNLRKKLGVNNVAQLIRLALGAGVVQT